MKVILYVTIYMFVGVTARLKQFDSWMEEHKTHGLPVICMWTASIPYVNTKKPMAHNTSINIDKYTFSVLLKSYPGAV